VLAIVTLTSLLLVVSDDSLGAVGILVGVGVMSVGLVALLDADRRGNPIGIGPVALAGAVVLGTAVLVAPHDSNDLWSYAMYGRILSVHRASPWAVTPAHFPADPFLAHVARGWRHTTSIYGPVFELLAASITRIAGDATAVVRMLFTASFAAAAGAAAWVVYRRTGRAAAAALVLLHPAIVLATLAGGHNDALVGLGLLGATVLIADDRPVAAGFAAGAATLVKLTGGIGILALAAWSLAHRSRRTATVFAAVGGGLVALAYLPLGASGLSAFVHNRGSLSRASAWELPRLLTGLDHRHTPINLGLPASTTQLLVSVGALVTVVLTLAVAIRMRRADHPAVALIAALGTYLVVAPYVLPWYPAWVIPALALVIERPVARLLALQAAVLVVVFEVKTQSVGPIASTLIWWSAVCISVAVALVFVLALRRSQRARVVVTPTAAAPLPAG
jgi:hypothetical protein